MCSFVMIHIKYYSKPKSACWDLNLHEQSILLFKFCILQKKNNTSSTASTFVSFLFIKKQNKKIPAANSVTGN